MPERKRFFLLRPSLMVGGPWKKIDNVKILSTFQVMKSIIFTLSESRVVLVSKPWGAAWSKSIVKARAVRWQVADAFFGEANDPMRAERGGIFRQFSSKDISARAKSLSLCSFAMESASNCSRIFRNDPAALSIPPRSDRAAPSCFSLSSAWSMFSLNSAQ